MCGCGVPDTDEDLDGVADCNDGCSVDPDKVEPGACGCGNPDTDTDGDGIPDCLDGCPEDMNKAEEGACGCGVSDADTTMTGMPDCLDGGLCVSDVQTASFVSLSEYNPKMLVTFEDVEGGVNITVKLTDLSTDATKDPPAKMMVDIRGLFFDCAVDLAEDAIIENKYVHDYLVVNDPGIAKLNNDVLVTGGGNELLYDAVVEFGTRGLSRDDYQEVYVVVTGVTAADFVDQDIALRLTSVGFEGAREESSKLLGTAAPCE
jgi:hypothetical protein